MRRDCPHAARPLPTGPTLGRALLVPLALLALLALRAPAPLAADTLELLDGRVVEGEVELVEEGYRVRTRLGEATVPRAEVRTHRPGASIDSLLEERLARLAPDDAENRARLAQWLLDLGRVEAARALAEAALELDAENATAHAVLGHERHGGHWMTHAEAMRAKGLEEHDGRWYTPEEWRNLAAGQRAAVEEVERRARAGALAREVNVLVQRMASPDPAVRVRARERLLALAGETGNKDLPRLVGQVEAWVKAADDYARARAAGATGSVLAECRISLSKLRRPIQTFETSLASGGAGAPVRIQLPELEVINLKSMVGLPAVVDR
ncbi:MAG: hypothetical protein ACKOSS_03400 [Planctomycetia bacterium]